MRVMKTWSAFSANDINNDNMLDLYEMKLLIWLISKAKPTVAELEKEMTIMDRDHSKTIDRIEWVGYLSAPVRGSVYQLGNMDYYDFEMRAQFEAKDINNNGFLDFDELCDLIKLDLGNSYAKLDEERQQLCDPLIKTLAKDVTKALKKLASEISNPNCHPNEDPLTLNWVEFARFGQVCKMQKTELLASTDVFYHQQRKDEFQRAITNNVAGEDLLKIGVDITQRFSGRLSGMSSHKEIKEGGTQQSALSGAVSAMGDIEAAEESKATEGKSPAGINIAKLKPFQEKEEVKVQ